MNKQIKISSIVAVIIIVFVLSAYLIYSVIKGTGTITIDVAPQSTSYHIGSKLYFGTNTIKLSSGKHKITFKANNYATKEGEFTVLKNTKTNYYVTMDLENTYKTGENIEILNQEKGDQSSRKLGTNYPIVTQLPKITNDFRIDYGFKEGTNSFFLLITIYLDKAKTNEKEEIFKESAKTWLLSQGFDPSSVSIEWAKEYTKKLDFDPGE